MALFGGSKSSTTQNNTNQDARVVGGNDSINESLAINGGGNTITRTDFGAVSGGLALALRGVESVESIAQQTIGQSGELLSGALGAMAKQSSEHAQALENIKGGDVRTLVIVGLLVAGVVGVSFLRKG